MENKTVFTVSVTLLITFSGYLIKYFNDLYLARRKDRLERVNQQLRDLYGPLFSLVKVSTITWNEFKEQYCSRDDFRAIESPEEKRKAIVGTVPQSEEAKRIWRHWIQSVFMPLNEEMAQLITDHADLLEEENIPDCWLMLSAHVHGYKGIVQAWKQGDFSEHMSLVPFPSRDLFPYAESSYRRLKIRQAKLLGRRQEERW